MTKGHDVNLTDNQYSIHDKLSLYHDLYVKDFIKILIFLMFSIEIYFLLVAVKLGISKKKPQYYRIPWKKSTSAQQFELQNPSRITLEV